MVTVVVDGVPNMLPPPIGFVSETVKLLSPSGTASSIIVTGRHCCALLPLFTANDSVVPIGKLNSVPRTVESNQAIMNFFWSCIKNNSFETVINAHIQILTRIDISC